MNISPETLQRIKADALAGFAKGFTPKTGRYGNCEEKCGCAIGAVMFNDGVLPTKKDQYSADTGYFCKKYGIEEHSLGEGDGPFINGFDTCLVSSDELIIRIENSNPLFLLGREIGLIAFGLKSETPN